MKKFALWVLIFVFISTIVLADELKITDIDAIVNGNLINNVDSNNMDLEVRPGDRVDLIIEFENEHRPSTNIDIQVLDLFISLDNLILSSESMNFDIDAGEEVTRKLTFTVPDLKENAYALKIEVEGRDDDNHIQEDIEFINLVLKDNQNIFVEKISKPANQITAASTSEVRVRFAENPYSNVQNKESNFPYLLISLIVFFMFILVLLILFVINKNKQ